MTMDIEPDIIQYLKDSYIGVEEGLPRFIKVLEGNKIKTDFFVTGDVCEKYPELVRRICDHGHNLGCHGYSHAVQYYCQRKLDWQYDDLSKATGIIEKTTRHRPVMFRAPNFSANGDTIKALETLRYEIDSSVLPGRLVKKLRFWKVIDHREAPKEPYLPSKGRITERGESNILEIPVTENPMQKGSPIGAGYLNLHGVEETIKAIHMVDSNHVLFLLHPWECINLGEYHEELPQWIKAICRENHRDIALLIEKLRASDFIFSSLASLVPQP